MNKVGVIMGSKSDYPVMEEAISILKDLNIKHEVNIVSAHRTPDKMMDYSKNASKNGIGVIIAGAGGAAHLPGMVASNTHLPVIGVPIKSRNSIDGWDSVLSVSYTHLRAHCLLYTSPSPRDRYGSRMPSSA